MNSVHDNEMISYEVNLKSEYIVLHTEDRGKAVMVTFSGVLAHLFEDHLNGSILLDISDYEIEQFVDRNKELFGKQSPYRWLLNYESMDELKEILIKKQYKCYIICSSYGFNGWVLAKELSVGENEH